MAAYLDLAGFKAITVMPAPDVDELEERVEDWIDGQLELVSADIDSRLRKRYAAPFSTPVPLTVKRWLARIVTRECYLKRGVDPLDPQWTSIEAAATKAEEEIKEAADSETGLFDLPLRADTTSTGISKGGPYGYSEQSPYVWTTKQARTGHEEDRNGEGTYG